MFFSGVQIPTHKIFGRLQGGPGFRNIQQLLTVDSIFELFFFYDFEIFESLNIIIHFWGVQKMKAGHFIGPMALHRFSDVKVMFFGLEESSNRFGTI